MSRTVQITIELDEEQAEALRRRAEALGISERELLLRGALDTVQTDRQREWDEERIYIENNRKFSTTPSLRGWTREELYDQHLSRYAG